MRHPPPPSHRRRDLLAWPLLAAPASAWPAGAVPSAQRADFASDRPGVPLAFPRDHGAHPDFRTEWWYLTGWLEADAREFGIQLTFFRSRTTHAPGNPSRFAPHQLLLAHLALADPALGRLRHAQRAVRVGFRDAEVSTQDTSLRLGDWQLARQADDRYRLRAGGADFAIDLVARPATTPVAQGEAGFSRKGPRETQASYYYSRPQLAIGGEIRLEARRHAVSGGVAWLDHEWSSEVLDPRAAGWDWVGLNLDDGRSLMAFRIRTRDGAELWSHARWSDASQPAPAPRFEPRRHWRSPRSAGRYPVEMSLTVGEQTFTLVPMFDDQEIDARASTGGHYWEGAVRVVSQGRSVGRGYLELTGYAAPLSL